MKLFLDDIRPCPRGYIKIDNYQDCIEFLLKNRNKIDTISLDHDLGEIKTGYDVCKWIVANEYYDNLQEIIIHSANPVGTKNMLQLLDKYCPDHIKLFYIDISKNYNEFYRIKENYMERD